MADVINLKHLRWVDRLIRAGYLQWSHRRDPVAIEAAVDRMHKDSEEFFRKPESAPDPEAAS